MVSQDRLNRIEETLGEIRGKMGGVSVSLDALASQIQRQNGRVSKSEEWHEGHARLHAHADGAQEVRAAWSKRELTILAALAVAMLGLVTDVVRTIIIHGLAGLGS